MFVSRCFPCSDARNIKSIFICIYGARVTFLPELNLKDTFFDYCLILYVLGAVSFASMRNCHLRGDENSILTGSMLISLNNVEGVEIYLGSTF